MLPVKAGTGSFRKKAMQRQNFAPGCKKIMSSLLIHNARVLDMKSGSIELVQAR